MYDPDIYNTDILIHISVGTNNNWKLQILHDVSEVKNKNKNDIHSTVSETNYLNNWNFKNCVTIYNAKLSKAKKNAWTVYN